MPDKTITLIPGQAQRLINTYCYVTEPEPDAVERLTRGALSLYDTPRGDLVEFECDVYGEPVSWLSLDEIDALVYGGLARPPIGRPALHRGGRRRRGHARLVKAILAVLGGVLLEYHSRRAGVCPPTYSINFRSGRLLFQLMLTRR